MTDAVQQARTASLKRIFAMLFMLEQDFKFTVQNHKDDLAKLKLVFGVKHKEYKICEQYYQAHSKGFNNTINSIRELAKLTLGTNSYQIIKDEMTSERIKDLHSFFDVILDIANISVITDIIRIGLEEKLEDGKEQING